MVVFPKNLKHLGMLDSNLIVAFKFINKRGNAIEDK